MNVPPASRWYWFCQAAGWTAYATYVAAIYFIFVPNHEAGAVAGIVFSCTVPPLLLTHALRAWMYVNGWPQLSEWRRKVRQFPAAFVLAVVATFAVGVVVGLSRGRLWVRTEGLGWTLLGYYLAFGGWVWIYETVHMRRRRDDLERLARETQLRALQAQLNPHFLFNSLNSVRSLITEDPQRAASMVTGLSDILRYSLASGRKDTVPLADELGVIEEYLSVERVRFEERLRVEQLIDPGALSVPVPPMIVQTLVENAVKHGIAASSDGGLVRIDARVHDSRLDVVITNNGPFKPAVDGGGYGLQNATERLQLMYGGRASLTVESDGDRTVASLRLPVEPAVQS